MQTKVILTLTALSVIFPLHLAQATDSYQVTASSTQTITEHSECRKVTNSNSKGLFVPTKTSTEWQSFWSASPPSVTIGRCSGDLLAVALDSSPYVMIYKSSDFSSAGAPAVADRPAGQGNAVSFSPDGAYLAVGHTGGSFLTVYRTSDWTKVTLGGNPPGNVFSVAFSPDGSKLVTGGATSPFMAIYNTSTWATSGPGTTPSAKIWALKFNPAGTNLLVGHNSGVNLFETTGFTTITAPAGATQTFGVDYSPNGTWLGVADFGGTSCALYRTSDLVRTGYSASGPNAMVFNSDSTRFACGSNSSLRICDPTTYTGSSASTTCTAVTTAPAGAVGKGAIAFSPDNTRMAVGVDTTPFLQYYDTSTYTTVTGPNPTLTSAVNAVAFTK